MKHISLGGLDVSRRCETVAVNTEHFSEFFLTVRIAPGPLRPWPSAAANTPALPSAVSHLE